MISNMNISRFFIGNIGVSIVNLKKCCDAIDLAIQGKKYGYICVTNSRTLHYGNVFSEYSHIQNNSLLTVPDGMPLVWIGKNLGYQSVGRVSGQDLMAALFENPNYTHYFYGSTPDTIKLMKDKLVEKFPLLNIKGMISPPFQPLENFDIHSLANEINKIKPTFFWCGLGAPKQENLIHLLQPKLEETICVGVGLAFEYWAGNVKRAPIWMQKNGFEWLFRLAQQPKNIKRAIRPISWIFLELIHSFFKRK